MTHRAEARGRLFLADQQQEMMERRVQMRRITAVSCGAMLVFLSLSQARAAELDVTLNALMDPGVFDPIEVFVGILSGSLDEEDLRGNAIGEYSFDDANTEVKFNGEDLDSPAPLSQRTFAPIALANESSNAPFESLLITIQDDITLQDGTLIGDVVAYGLFNGSGTYEGESIRQLSYSLKDSTGTVIDGVGLNQLDGLDFADFTSGTINVLTDNSIINGTITSYSSTLIPIPAAAWLFGSALGLLGWLKRRAG